MTVKIASADGTAIAANGDYTPLPASTLTFTKTTGPSQTVLVSVAAGPATESTETFTVNLSAQSTNASLADKQGVGTIVN